jgi:Leucine-rich repeat (LRR) protein
LKGLENMKNLKFLFLWSNQIHSLNELENNTDLFELNLFENQIRSLKELQNLIKLKSLYLASNQIESLEGLENLKQLKFLDLTSNRIKFIIELENLFQFTILKIGSNEIQFRNSFCNVFKFNERHLDLKLIDLKMNQVKSLVNFTFSNLKYLSLIYLDENLIETIATNTFFNLPNVKLISLKNNRIKLIEDHSFSSLNIEYSLELFGNKNLSKISPFSFSNVSFSHFSYESIVSLKNSFYSWFQMGALDLRQNNIKVIYENTIKGTFYKLILSENLIASFEKNSFGFLPNLTEINLSKNLIKKLDFHFAFSFSIPKLIFLDFSYNKIDFIDGFRFFSKFPVLEYLDLSFNDLHYLQNTFFLNLNELKYLILGNNQILTIQNGSFDHLKNLLHLDLSQNLIYELNGDFFVPLNKLQSLSLKSNKLVDINNRESLRGLISLHSIDLCQNQILSLEENFFPSNLTHLKLRSNKLRFLKKSFKLLESLDLSFNNLITFNLSLTKNINFLDLSNNVNLLHLDLSNELRILNLSNTNTNLILNLKFYDETNLEELDLSFNNLSEISFDFLFSLKKLKILNLRETYLRNFVFLYEFSNILQEIDLSSIQTFGADYSLVTRLNKIEVLRMSNSSLLNFNFESSVDFRYLKYLDLSKNLVKRISTLPSSIIYLNLSYNMLEFIFDEKFESKFFLMLFLDLKIIDFSQSFSKSFLNKIFFFNKLIEEAYFSKNNINLFPKFCQVCSNLYDFCKPDITDCKLRKVAFNSNALKQLFYLDLFEMINLEYLDLENNSISSIELHSFSNLIKLETLILSLNILTYFNDTFIFSPLSSLKFLNLSSNQIEIIQSNLFDSLLKLETLDLSLNRIRFIHSFAFNDLLNLKNLHLEENDKNLLIESNTSFSHLDSIQNIYLSKSILNDENVKVFLNLFVQKTKTQLNKKVLGISFYKSLFLSSKYTKYDCNLTLFFIRKNVHFNFKTETEIFDYFNECSLLTIKNSSFSVGFVKSNRNHFIFSDFGVYFFWMYFIFVLIICIYFLKSSENS